MPFSHHSHSGQFCGHAVNTLEEMVQTAIAQKFHTFCLTEHIPRAKEDLYPEEEGFETEESLVKLFDDYMVEAIRMRDRYSDKIHILIGFESEWIRPATEAIVRGLLDRYAGTLDLFMGSLHHVHTFPIDYDQNTYEAARTRAGGTDERLFEDYFDSQLQMLQTFKPPIVGHFDLIRLKSDDADTEFQGMKGVWERVKRNLEFISSYGGILELNSAALRKGLSQPYPCLSICQMFLSMGGRFVMSDDSHGIDHIATNYARMLDFINRAGIKQMHYASRDATSTDPRFPHTGFSSMPVEQLSQLPFWTKDQ